MSHIEIVEGHMIHDKLRESLQLVSEIRISDITLDQEQNLDRIHTVLNTFNTVLEKADPMFIIPSQLDSIMNNNIQSIVSYLNSFKQSKDNTQLYNAQSHIDVLCTKFREIYFPAHVDEIESIRESATSFRLSLSQHLRYASKESEELQQTVIDLHNEVNSVAQAIEAERNKIDHLIADLHRSYVEAETDRSKLQTDNLNEINDSFLDELSRIREDFEGIKQQIETEREVHRSELEAEREANRSEVKNIMESLITYQKEAKQILGTLSIDSHAAGYKREADRAWKTKNLFYGITGLLFVLLMGSAYWNSLHSAGEITWTSFISKWTITLAIGAAVTYFARQAVRQEQIERENRSLQLQMATLDPYIEIFEETERKEIKKILVDRIFTGVRQETSKDEKSASLAPLDIPKIIEAVANAIKIGK